MGRKSLLSKIGCEVKRLRQSCDLTQAELSKRSGVSRSYIRKIESKNPPNMTLHVLVKLAKGLKLKCSKLVKNASLNH